MRVSGRGKRRLAVLAGGLSLALAVTFSGHGAIAQTAAQTEEEDVPLDMKLLRGFLKDLGLKRDGEAEIEYRERAPLVVPPSRNLPPPQSGTVADSNPAWPKDPDVLQRKREAATKRKQPRSAHEAMIEEGRALRPDELDKGRGTPVVTGSTPASPRESARPLSPAELGSKGLFSGLFTSSGKGETAVFTAEPPRANLTEPPPGYQNPVAQSALRPYPEERAGETRHRREPRGRRYQLRGGLSAVNAHHTRRRADFGAHGLSQFGSGAYVVGARLSLAANLMRHSCPTNRF